MIEFITLFLGGLVTGPQNVEIMTRDAVAIVEVWLDGELEERLTAPPWRIEVDLGPELAPHALEAVALDAAERELGRTRQWINMAPETAQASVLIEGADRGQAAIARVSWESIAATKEPTSVEAYFDGQLLAADDPRAIELPTFDPGETHHFRARLEFGEALFSEAEAVFGGVYGNEVNTEISAVPIWFEKGKKPKSAQSVRDWFTVDGEPLSIHAIEKGLAKIVVVRDMATELYLDEFHKRTAMYESDIRLERHHRLEFISPCPKVHTRTGSFQFVFPRTQQYSSSDGTVLELLARVESANCTPERQKLADAVAAAGLAASQSGQRRVLLLLVSGDPMDRSMFTPSQVSAYLEKLRVPLAVWNVDSSKASESRWGQATNAQSLRRVRKAYPLLEKNLERQLIVWLDGLHLPQSVELRREVDGVALVR